MSIINIDKREVAKTYRNGRIYSVSSNSAVTSSIEKASDKINNTLLKYNVKEYGAVGDGITDDTLVIQSCIDDCHKRGGGIVYIPSGEYALTKGLRGYSNMMIVGEGRESTKLSTANTGYGGAEFGDGTAHSTNMLYFEDADNVVIKDLWLRGVGIDGSSSQGIVFDLLNGNNTAHIMVSNCLITDHCSNAAFEINTPILTTITNVKVLRVAGNGFYMYDGTSVTMNECYGITCTEAGFLFDTMTYNVFNSCASEVCGVGFYFSSCSATVLNGCGTEGILNRNDANDKYKYGELGYGQFKPPYDGFAYKSISSNIQLNSCYTRDPGTGHTYGDFDKINCREFTLYPLGVNVDYDASTRQSYVPKSTLAHYINSTDTTFSFAPGTGNLFPTSDFYVTVYDSTYPSTFAAYASSELSYGGNMEMIYVSSRNGDVATCPNRGLRNFWNRTEPRNFNTAGRTYNIDFAGRFYYAVTFFDKDGNETGLSDYPWRGYLTQAQIVVKNIPIGGDPSVCGRNIYRNSAILGTEEFQKIHVINDNTTTEWIDNVPDTGVVTPAAWPEPTLHRFSTTSGSSSVNVVNNRFAVNDVVKVDYSDYLPYPFSRGTSYKYVVMSSLGNTITVYKQEDTTKAVVTFSKTTTEEMYIYKYDMPGRSIGIENNFVTTFKKDVTFQKQIITNTAKFKALPEFVPILPYDSSYGTMLLSVDSSGTVYKNNLSNLPEANNLIPNILLGMNSHGAINKLTLAMLEESSPTNATMLLGMDADGILKKANLNNSYNSPNPTKFLTTDQAGSLCSTDFQTMVDSSSSMKLIGIDESGIMSKSNMIVGDTNSMSLNTKLIKITGDNPSILLGSTAQQALSVRMQFGKWASSLTPAQIIAAEWSTTDGWASYLGNWSPAGCWGIGQADGTSSSIRIGNVPSSLQGFSATQNLKLLVGGGIGIGDAVTIPSNGLTVQGRVLLAGAVDNETDALQVNGTVKMNTARLKEVGTNVAVATLGIDTYGLLTTNIPTSSLRISDNGTILNLNSNVVTVTGVSGAKPVLLIDNTSAQAASVRMQFGKWASSLTPAQIIAAEWSTTGGWGTYLGNWGASGCWGIGQADGTSATIRIGNVPSDLQGFSATQNLKLMIGGGIGVGSVSTGSIHTGGIYSAGSITTLNNFNVTNKSTLSGTVLVGGASDNGTDIMQVNGTVKATNIKVATIGTSAAVSPVGIDSTNKLTNNVPVPIISSGSAAPTSTPTKEGDIFVDKTNKKVYMATGITSSADWTIIN